uniref:Neuropeptide Y receptor type 1-like n=1 Tax=Saccoglossus kowalevskii TaxID=10224 RepID=A0ABM0H190_SACKO|nr:PREDICTED: neuropeptide Y receptor type 1-like [Saccoglossus kowalevskii]
MSEYAEYSDEESFSYDYGALEEKAAKLDTPPPLTVAFGVVFMIMIIVGNIWVIIAVFRQPKLRNSATNLFIVSLSVSDLMIAVFFIPYHVGHFAYRLPISNRAVCKLLGYLHWAAQCGTTFSLICIGVDRYRAIVQPMRPRFTVQHALIGCTIVSKDEQTTLLTITESPEIPPDFVAVGREPKSGNGVDCCEHPISIWNMVPGCQRVQHSLLNAREETILCY